MPAARISYHFPKDASVDLLSLWARSRHEAAMPIARSAIITCATLIQFEHCSGRVIVRDNQDQEWLFSAHRPFVHPDLEAYRAQQQHSPHGKTVPRSMFLSGASIKLIAYIGRHSFVASNADIIQMALAVHRDLIDIQEMIDHEKTFSGIYLRDRKGNQKYYNPNEPPSFRGLELELDEAPVVTAYTRKYSRRSPLQAKS